MAGPTRLVRKILFVIACALGISLMTISIKRALFSLVLKNSHSSTASRCTDFGFDLGALMVS
jgi:hypothetical protein